ncbi:type VII secretion protein EssC [Clostridium paraputrificum]|uniref:type VII secretion protein EssC n=1 Tax=Clostridium paraputrificum TaxID=29363 RepID=UPI003D3561C9
MSSRMVKNTIILFNEYFYNEVDLDSFNKDEIIISNSNLCDIKVSILRNEFRITLKKIDSYWLILESIDVDFVVNGTKVPRKKLVHGDQVSVLDDTRNEIFKINFFLDFSSGKEDYSRAVNINKVSEIKIGKAKDNDIIINDLLVDDYHCILRLIDNKRIITDLNSKYNVYLNGNKIIENSELKDNDFIILCGYKLLYKEEQIFCPRSNVDIVNKELVVNTNKVSILDYPEFIRTPRMLWKVPEDKVQIVAPPKKVSKPGMESFLNLIPTLGMSMMVLFMPFGNPIYRVGMLAVTVSTTLIMFIYNSVKASKSIKERNQMYIGYLEDREKEIINLYDKQKVVLNKLYPSMKEACNVIEKFESRLWEKSYKDKDFINVYLGEGTVDISFKIEIPNEEFGEREDELLLEPRKLKEKYSKIPNMPIFIDMKNNYGIGIVGDEENITNLVKNILFEIAVFNYSEDVNFICLCNEENIDKWMWMRWLPHIWSKNKQVRFMGVGKESCHSILDIVNSIVSKREEKDSSKVPHYVMIVTDPILLENEAISKYLDREVALDLGITTLYVYGNMELIPKQCSQIIEVTSGEEGRLIDISDSGNSIYFTFNKTRSEVFGQLTRRMGPIFVKKNYSENTLPKKITLYELYKVNNARELNIESRWNENDVTKSINAPLGVNAGGSLIGLNLHEKVHGPHGLVAGTTGSGKSELLQTIIISLAINYTPYDLSFILIDYKGGGMANLFLKIPHLIGTITNLDGNLVNRSLTLIKSELKRRQKIFAKYDVNHIDGYKKLEKKDKNMEPLPHLLIIADEFAELKSDQPEFMKELVSTARIGRSLGVHLILATQKPAGVVDSQIWSNSKFKLCLKVQDAGDSKEMLKKPDAAYIVEPGRGYLQVGNDEYYEMIQTAWSGAEKYIDDDTSSESIDISEVSIEGVRKIIYSSSKENEGKEKITQLDEIVNYIHDFSEYKGYKSCDNCWTEPLEENINLNTIITEDKYFYYNKDREYKKVEPIVGEIDYPNLLKKDKFKINFADDGNVILVGGSGYGKTTFIQTLVCSIISEYRTEEVNMYILDFGSRTLKVFEAAPHVGDVVFSDDRERLINLFKMMRKEIEKRKVIFSDNGASNLINYIEATNDVIPQIVIVIDNFAEFKENYEEFIEELIFLLREGQAYGINFVLTNSTSNGISYKIINNFKSKICLTCTDKTDYGNILGVMRVQPTKVKGRGLIVLEECYELQIARFGTSEKEFERLKEIKDFIDIVNKNYQGKKARRIITVPEKLMLKEVLEEIDMKKDSAFVPLGFNVNTLEYIGIPMDKNSNFVIIGNPKTGKTNMLKNILDVMGMNMAKFYIFDDNDEGLSNYSKADFVSGYASEKEEELKMLNEILDEGDRRRILIKEEGEEKLKELPYIVIIIDNIVDFISKIDRKSIDFVEDIVKVLKNYRIITIATGTDGDFKSNQYSIKFVKALKEAQTGILLDYIANQSYFTNVKVKYGTKERDLKCGDGYLILNNNFCSIKTPGNN